MIQSRCVSVQVICNQERNDMPWYLVVAALILALLVGGVIWSWVRLLLLPVSDALEREDERRFREHERLVAMSDTGLEAIDKPKRRR